MNRQYLLYCLKFNCNNAFYHQIQPVPAIELNITIYYRQRPLLFYFQSPRNKFERQTRFVSRFQ